ncbi:MAG: PEP/pyruvate-binding domain-containing protein [Bacteroidales bacterium]
MNPTEGPAGKIIEALQERAKELHCLYRVHELLIRTDVSIDEVCRSLLEVIPRGFQYPGACFARIILGESVYEPPRIAKTPWALTAPVVVQGEPVGAVEAYYAKQMPRADEGPFLKEERKLIDTIAERLSQHLMHRRLQAAFQNWRSEIDDLSASGRREWQFVVEFLRKTDPQLLHRIARRMVNYLCWNGVEAAQELLQQYSTGTDAQNPFADNQPLDKRSVEYVRWAADEPFSMAAEHLSEAEILSCIEKWIKDDKAGFLIKAVENQCTTLAGVVDALERYDQLGVGDDELSRSILMTLRVSLVRRFFTDDLEFINTAKNYIEIGDFYNLVHQLVSPPNSHGKLGGKSSGLFLASHIVKRSTEYADALSPVKVPKTWYLTSDGLMDFVEYNHLEDVYNRKYLEVDQIRREYPHIVHVFKNSNFSPEVMKGLSLALDDFDGRPLIVRSSSLLEDRMAAAFSGKYKSLFLANSGTKTERLTALMDAIAEVYASLFGPDPIEYRAERGMLDLHEEMGIMIQEVVGTRVGRYYFPAFAGVAFSNNEFRWSPRIKREDGLVRLVPGLGTRAVDRVSDDYPVLIAPGQPGLRVNVSADEVVRYAPKKIDAINLESGRFETVDIDDLLKECGEEFPRLNQIVSVCDEDGIHRPMAFGWDPKQGGAVVTFDGLIGGTPFVQQMRALLKLLREKLGVPVDIEFASDGRDFYLLQCRPQSYATDATATPIPRDVPAERVVFTAKRYVSNGKVPDITHIVYVDPDGYNEISELTTLKDVGRAVGRLNKLLPKRQFVLMGPGRWGSRGDIKLGVSVTYSDLNNAAVLMEIATRRGLYSPDLSFGTHFFQDLVEAGIRYLPLYPGDAGVIVNETFLRESPSILTDLVPEFAELADVVRVIDVPHVTSGQVLRIVMNGDADEALGFLGPPTSAPAAERRKESEQAPEDHWRWRLRMAERIAAEVDPKRFGIKGMYVFGSTKNATAGPGSDIDLLVHVNDDDAATGACRELHLWLDGWSRCLGEMNFLRTGTKSEGLLDVHIVTDTDIANHTSFAAKIGAVTDAARPLVLRRA